MRQTFSTYGDTNEPDVTAQTDPLWQEVRELRSDVHRLTKLVETLYRSSEPLWEFSPQKKTIDSILKR